MKTSLSSEQREALRNHPEGIEVEDETNNRLYVLTDASLHHRALAALKAQEDIASIQAGIDDMEAGRVKSFEEVDRRIRAKLGIADGDE